MHWVTAIDRESKLKLAYRCDSAEQAAIVVRNLKSDDRLSHVYHGDIKNTPVAKTGYKLKLHTIRSHPEMYMSSGTPRSFEDAVRPLKAYMQAMGARGLEMDIKVLDITPGNFESIQQVIPGNTYVPGAILNACTDDGYLKFNMYRKLTEASQDILEQLQKEVQEAMENRDFERAADLEEQRLRLKRKLESK